jgi:glycosyltransferase involved in cell wall biosynthesis
VNNEQDNAMHGLPRITIVTPSYNQADFIEETIDSVLSQGYPNLQYIIIDGGSTDGSPEIISKYQPFLDYWTSEPDKGQADALNKGFAQADGDICAYLNSDDLLLPGCLMAVAALYLHTSFFWIHSRVLSGDSLWESALFQNDPGTFESFCAQQTFAQQGVFWALNSLPRPFFNPSLRFVMDHDFFIRLYRKHGPPISLERITAFFRQHPSSKTSTLEEVLHAERRRIGLCAADQSSPKLAMRIRKEIRRLDLKTASTKALRRIEESETRSAAMRESLGCFGYALADPLPFRDRVLWGTARQSLRLALQRKRKASK